MKIIRVSLLVMALACSVYAGEIDCGVASTGVIPNGVTSSGEIPSDGRTAGEISNDVTSAGDMPFGATSSAMQKVTQITTHLLAVLLP
jgi:hypothetical protein